MTYDMPVFNVLQHFSCLRINYVNFVARIPEQPHVVSVQLFDFKR